jgi:hypothetical protein
MAANRSGPLTIRAPQAGAALRAEIRRSGCCYCRGVRRPSAVSERVSPPPFRGVVVRQAGAPAPCRKHPRWFVIKGRVGLAPAVRKAASIRRRSAQGNGAVRFQMARPVLCPNRHHAGTQYASRTVDAIAHYPETRQAAFGTLLARMERERVAWPQN